MFKVAIIYYKSQHSENQRILGTKLHSLRPNSSEVNTGPKPAKLHARKSYVQGTTFA